MENFENESVRPEDQPAPQQPSSETPTDHTTPQYTPASEPRPYSGSGSGRRESPFTDSPYVNQFDGRNGNPYQGYVPPQPQPQKPRKEKKKHPGVWKTVLASVLTLTLVAGSCGITAGLVNSHWSRKTQQMTADFNSQLQDLQAQVDNAYTAITGTSVSGSNLAGEGLTPGQVYARNVQSVVAISNQGTTMNLFGQVSETASSGSGFILTADGYVVTNFHVIEGASKLTVITYDEVEYDAKVVGYDSNNDLALLKVEAEDLPAVTIGSSDELIVGDMVVAIGNPLGELTSTQTVGYVSAKERDVTTGRSTINMIQTDAAINPGNSGGPLFNMRGEVVGITTAKYSGSTGSGASIEGIGFAIPIDDVIGMIESLQTHGYVTGAYLGIMVRNVDPQAATLYGLPLGSYVESVNEGSCAEKAGIQAKDIITALGEHRVESNTDLTRALRKFDAGDTTTVEVCRAGKTLTLTITLDEKPHEAAPTDTDPEVQPEMPENGSYDEWFEYFAPFFGQG